MRRRGFLVGLLALPFVAPLARAAQAVKRRLWPTVTVGAGGDVATIAEAFERVEAGGTIYVLPGIHEIHGPIGPSDTASGWAIIGSSGESRPKISLTRLPEKP